jgi:hypothetical protein
MPEKTKPSAVIEAGSFMIVSGVLLPLRRRGKLHPRVNGWMVQWSKRCQRRTNG